MATDMMIQREKKIPSPVDNGEYGFFIACDDRSILNCVNSMLLSSGVFRHGWTDALSDRWPARQKLRGAEGQ